MNAQPTPPEAAATLLTKHNGDERAAEVDAWKMAGKGPMQTGQAPTPQFAFFHDVAHCIVEGREFPEVPRDLTKPTHAAWFRKQRGEEARG